MLTSNISARGFFSPGFGDAWPAAIPQLWALAIIGVIRREAPTPTGVIKSAERCARHTAYGEFGLRPSEDDIGASLLDV